MQVEDDNVNIFMLVCLQGLAVVTNFRAARHYFGASVFLLCDSVCDAVIFYVLAGFFFVFF